MTHVEKAQGKAPKFEQDIRKVLDDKSIDVVTHRHAQPLARPGRHLGHAGRQGRLRREAGQPQRQRRPAHRRGRPQVQPDLPDRHAEPQQHRHARGDRRSCTPASSARSTLARGLCYKPRGSIGKVDGAAAAVPTTIDYDLWCGPAPMKPLMRKQPALRLALDLGLRQRRPRQPGHPPDGQGPLGPGQERAAQRGRQHRRPLRLRRRRRDGQHAGLRLRLRRQRADLRGPRPAKTDPDLQAAAQASATSSTAPRATWSARATPAASPIDQDGEVIKKFERRRRPLRQLRQGRPQPQARGPERRHPGRPPVQRPVPPGQHQLPAGRARPAFELARRASGQAGPANDAHDGLHRPSEGERGQGRRGEVQPRPEADDRTRRRRRSVDDKEANVDADAASTASGFVVPDKV